VGGEGVKSPEQEGLIQSGCQRTGREPLPPLLLLLLLLPGRCWAWCNKRLAAQEGQGVRGRVGGGGHTSMGVRCHQGLHNVDSTSHSNHCLTAYAWMGRAGA
jgi:hypothetical protein